MYRQGRHESGRFIFKEAPPKDRFQSSMFSKRRRYPLPTEAPDSNPHSEPILHRALQFVKPSCIYNFFNERFTPTIKVEYDACQDQFPLKGFPTPKRTWYNIPTKDDGSHSWPFTEIWPPQFIVDLRRHIPLFVVMFLAIAVPICLVQQYAYPVTQKVGNRPGYDCM